MDIPDAELTRVHPWPSAVFDKAFSKLTNNRELAIVKLSFYKAGQNCSESYPLTSTHNRMNQVYIDMHVSGTGAELSCSLTICLMKVRCSLCTEAPAFTIASMTSTMRGGSFCSRSA